MDDYGIYTSIMAHTRTLVSGGRRTGRTEAMIARINDGDQVIFSEQKEAKRVEHRLKKLGIKAICFVVAPQHPRRVFDRDTPQGRTIFDHGWVEDFWLWTLQERAETLARLQRESSGYGIAHRETRAEAYRLQAKDFRP